MTKTLKNNALSNQIKESIMKDILTGKVKPGEKLIESLYAAEFNVSRAPIREAFYLLTIEGLAEKVPRKGTIVKGYNAEEIADLLNVRRVLEDMSLEKLRSKDYNNYISKMDTILSQMRICNSEKEYTKLNYDFHLYIILASESSVIKNLYLRLSNVLFSLQSVAFLDKEDIIKSIIEHEELLEYLVNRDIDGAKQLLEKHNNSVFERFERNSHSHSRVY